MFRSIKIIFMRIHDCLDTCIRLSSAVADNHTHLKQQHATLYVYSVVGLLSALFCNLDETESVLFQVSLGHRSSTQLFLLASW